MSNVSARNSAISDPLPMHQDQVEEKYSTAYQLIWTERSMKNLSKKQLVVRQ